MKRVVVWIVAGIVGAGLIPGPFPVPVRGAEKTERIKITVPVHSTTFAPLYHARAAGYFAEEGLDVEVVWFRAPAVSRRCSPAIPSSPWHRGRFSSWRTNGASASSPS